MDGSLPGSSAHGIFQARVLEWSAIALALCISNRKSGGFIFTKEDSFVGVEDEEFWHYFF